VYSFGDYRLIPARQLLLRGSCPVRVGTRALDLLRLLVERQGELVSKEQLIGHAWPDTFVHESNLKVNIAALRRTLLQGRSELPFIATIPGRGYRFVTPVRVETEALPAFAPPQAGLPHDYLPPPRALIGRDEAISDLAAELVATGFLTIVGPAGVGKTAAAVAVARQVAEHYEDGVRFIDFSTIGDARLVCPAIASSIGASGALADLLCGILEALRGQRSLLVFDNCEHLLTSISLVADQIRSTLPDIGVLATSREPLRSQFEAIHSLAPLAYPGESPAMSLKDALSFPAVELFVVRANEATGYELSDADVQAVTAVCRKLDGIPLAMELAAPRLASDDPTALLCRLEQGFDVLNYGPRNAPARHQALVATLDWSYRLLSDREAKVLRLLSVFAGAFTLDDVIALGASLDVPADDLVRCVGNLATKSLLSSRLSEGRLLYRMLGATRAYAGERLRQAGEESRVLASHAAVLLSVFERAEQEWPWRSAQDWTACYAPRLNDLLKAIDWALGQDGALTIGLRLTCLAAPLWDQLSLIRESLSRLQLALELTRGRPGYARDDTFVRARSLLALWQDTQAA
jgi:predicted ATPase/DNA-binding winged helix-turn-helix (wHTH) protein